MDRRTIIFRTSVSKSNKNEDKFLSAIDQSFTNYIEECLFVGTNEESILSAKTNNVAVIPDPWRDISQTQDIQGEIKKSFVFQSKDASIVEYLNGYLDEISDPGKYLVRLIWICDEISKTLTPELFGVLDRISSYHNGEIILVHNQAGSFECPVWSRALGVKIVSLESFDRVLSASLVWRGNLVLSNDPDEILEDFELHCHQDELDYVLQKIRSANKHSSMIESKSEKDHYFGSNLELVCDVDPLSVPQTYLSNHHFQLRTNNKDNEASRMLMEDGFSHPRTAYIARLRMADTLPKKYEKRTSENWRKHVIEDSVNTHDQSYLDDMTSYLFFLIYTVDVSNEDVYTKSVVLLKNARTMIDTDFKLKYRPKFSSVSATESVIYEVNCLSFVSSFSLLQIYKERRQSIADALRHMIGEENIDCTKRPVEELLIDVENKIDQTFFAYINKHVKVVERPPVIKTQLTRRRTKLTSEYSEECSEKKFLRLVTPKPEIQPVPSSIIDSRREGTISLEAKEILKFFNQSSGSPAKNVPLDPLSPRSKCSVYMAENEYLNLLKDNFMKLSVDPDKIFFKDQGYMFVGQDFRNFEFKKYHDVFYNHGVSSERIDKDFTRMRDVHVGMSKETRTTFDLNKAPEKLKLTKSPAVTMSVRRRSPRKAGPKGKSSMDLKSSRRSDLTINNHRSGIPNHSATRSNKREAAAAPSSANDWKRKIRVAVTVALKKQKIEERNPLFSRCFKTLVKMCQIAVPDHSVGNYTQLLIKVAESNVENIIKVEAKKLKAGNTR